MPDTTLAQVIPADCNKRFAAKVTVRMLLTHTDGSGGVDLFGAENSANRAKAKNVSDMVALHHCRKPAFEPGTKTDYDNFGFVILGRMLEVVSGQRFEDYITSHVFAPAGMSQSFFLNCGEQLRRRGIARGYAEVDGKKVPNCTTMPNRGFPAGGQWSTAGDMFRFTKALREGKLVPARLFTQATTTYRQGFGLGFFATGYGPKTPVRDFRWGHGGQGDQITNDVRV
jgi:CubicO group peptidase (beta-lactamase class C family)